MFITTCNLQRKSLGGRLCSRGRRWSRQPRSPTVPRADPAPSASPACTGGPMGALPGLGTEPITSPALRPPPARLGSHLCPRTPRSPPVHWPQQPGPRAGGAQGCGRARVAMATPGAPLPPDDCAAPAVDGDPGCCPYPWRRCVSDTGSPGGSAAPRRRAAATASDSARCGHSAPGGGRTPGPRETGPRGSSPAWTTLARQGKRGGDLETGL